MHTKKMLPWTFLFTPSPIDVMKLSFYEFTDMYRYFKKINNCRQVDIYSFDTKRDTALHMQNNSQVAMFYQYQINENYFMFTLSLHDLT